MPSDNPRSAVSSSLLDQVDPAFFIEALTIALRSVAKQLRRHGFDVATDRALLGPAAKGAAMRLLRPVFDDLWRQLRAEARDGASRDELILTLADIIAQRVAREIVDFDPEDPTPGGRPRSPLSTFFVVVCSQARVDRRAGGVAGLAEGLLAFLAEKHDAILTRARAALLSTGSSRLPGGRCAQLRRALVLAIDQVLGDYGGGGWTAKINKALRQAPVELDLGWLLTVDGALHLSAVDPATSGRMLTWHSARSGRSVRAPTPRTAHQVRGQVRVLAHGDGVSVQGRPLANGESVRIEEGTMHIEVRGEGVATVREIDRSGVVGESRATPVVLTRDSAPREALEPFLLRVKGGQALTATRMLVVSSPQGCVVEHCFGRIRLGPHVRHHVDLSTLIGPLGVTSDVPDACILFGRPARFRRAVRVERRSGVLRAALYVEALDTAPSAVPWRYDDLEVRVRALQFLSMRMAEGGELEDVPDAAALFVERVVQMEPRRPIAIVDMRRLLCARAAWAVPGAQGPPTLAWADDRDDDLIPLGLGWCDAADRGISLSGEWVSSLARALVPAKGGKTTRAQILSHPGFQQLLRHLHRDGPEDVAFQHRLADRLAILNRG